MYVRLTGRASRQGPPPGGGNPRQGLRGMALCSRRSANGPRHHHWGDLPS